MLLVQLLDQDSNVVGEGSFSVSDLTPRETHKGVSLVLTSPVHIRVQKSFRHAPAVSWRVLSSRGTFASNSGIDLGSFMYGDKISKRDLISLSLTFHMESR